jgi:NAD(P)-dependent dehydrogenase (short-subunit alcohol dehydrogenase family)
MKIKDKNIVITGGASGIGKAMAESFSHHKANSIVVVDINESLLNETRKDIDAIPIVADISNENEILRIIDIAKERVGNIDIFCSNAGIGGAPGLINTSQEDWQTIWQVNVMSHIYAAKHLIPSMIKQGGGYLVNTASAAGLLTQIGSAGYSVTKSAAISFAEWLKITYGERGIGVSCLCPQGVSTSMVNDAPKVIKDIVSIDGILEPSVVAEDVIKAIENDVFLITPHKQVMDYIKMKSTQPDTWISAMQNLQSQFIDGISAAAPEDYNISQEDE